MDYTLHPVAGLVGNTRFHYAGDVQHIGCLGLVQTACGSSLAELVAGGPCTGSTEQRTSYYFKRIKILNRKLCSTTTINRLVKTMFLNPKGWNCLKAKAAESQ